jgi:hypothetical protein
MTNARNVPKLRLRRPWRESVIEIDVKEPGYKGVD